MIETTKKPVVSVGMIKDWVVSHCLRHMHNMHMCVCVSVCVSVRGRTHFLWFCTPLWEWVYKALASSRPWAVFLKIAQTEVTWVLPVRSRFTSSCLSCHPISFFLSLDPPPPQKRHFKCSSEVVAWTIIIIKKGLFSFRAGNHKSRGNNI